MATQPPAETPMPGEPVQPDTPPPEINVPGPDIDQPAPGGSPVDPGTQQPAQL